jgi:hypothetical protein|tara:strand:- start:383 stop:676 length:294 start_codon:yes stop_codon:yes gene_type:complete
MISNEHIGEAIQRNNDVDTCQFLGKGIFLLRMADWELPQKMNSYAVMKTVDPDWFDIAFSPNVYVTNLMEENWEEVESDDGHRELYDDLDIDDTVLE